MFKGCVFDTKSRSIALTSSVLLRSSSASRSRRRCRRRLRRRRRADYRRRRSVGRFSPFPSPSEMLRWHSCSLSRSCGSSLRDLVQG